MKIAIIADIHLPDRPDTTKEEVLDWALYTAVGEQVSLIVSAGDMILAGAIEAARRLYSKLKATGCPFLVAMGNTEIDTLDDFRKIFGEENFFRHEHGVVAVINGAIHGGMGLARIDLNELLKNVPESLMMVGHFPLESLPLSERSQLEAVLRKQPCTIYVAGHKHIDQRQIFGNGEYHIVRGLDPDKAIGAPPGLHIFEYNHGARKWLRQDFVFKPGNPTHWTCDEADDFRALLGISSMHNTLEKIQYATSRQIKCLEVRFEAVKNLPSPELAAAIHRWRTSGGKILSMHFPDIAWNMTKNEIAKNEIRQALKLATKLKINRLTIHVPRCSVALLSTHRVRQKFLNSFEQLIKVALSLDISVGIENLHMRQEEKPDDNRGFGYTPGECVEWINELRTICHSSEIGLHFDIGHARNNVPYSSIFTLSQWYATVGLLINGYHLHQVTTEIGGTFKNHQPIRDIFGPLISYTSFFHAWKRGKIAHAPMFIETSLGTKLSFETLYNCFSGIVKSEFIQ